VHSVTGRVTDADADEQFVVFVRTEGARLLRFAVLLSGSRADAEDLLQDALTGAYARWPHVRTHDPGAYVRRSIANARVSAWRRTRRLHPVADLPEAASPDVFAASDDWAALSPALAALSHPQRAVLLLRHLEGWDYAAISDALSLSQATVRSHHARGLARLRAHPDLRPTAPRDCEQGATP